MITDSMIFTNSFLPVPFKDNKISPYLVSSIFTLYWFCSPRGQIVSSRTGVAGRGEISEKIKPIYFDVPNSLSTSLSL